MLDGFSHKWAGLALTALGFVAAGLTWLWRLATARFVRHEQMEERLKDQQANFFKMMEHHAADEKRTLDAMAETQEEMNKNLSELSRYLRNVPTRDEYTQQQKAVSELGQQISRLSGTIDASNRAAKDPPWQ